MNTHPTRQWAHGLVFAILAVISIENLEAQDFDILIRNGRVLDGTGSPEFLADVGIRGDEIVALGKLTDATARRVIDASMRASES